MRTPKFRAWLKEEKRMTDVHEITFFSDKVQMISCVEGFYAYDEYELMQSTGLKDKNGKEIFEGDIVVAMSQGVKEIGEVKHRIDGYWLMYPAWQHGEFWNIVKNVDTGETGVEIIGNIYENPEFLDGE